MLRRGNMNALKRRAALLISLLAVLVALPSAAMAEIEEDPTTAGPGDTELVDKSDEWGKIPALSQSDNKIDQSSGSGLLGLKLSFSRETTRDPYTGEKTPAWWMAVLKGRFGRAGSSGDAPSTE